jgi:hypothetical protein
MARFFLMINKFTGAVIMIDTYQRRLARMRRKLFRWAEIIKVYYPNKKKVMITLTYDVLGTLVNASDWEAGDIVKFIDKLEYRLKKHLYGYAWVAELQANGHVHYHVLVVVDKRTIIGHVDYLGLWSKGMSKVGNCKAGAHYICSYASKKYQKDFSKYPKGARLFGVSCRKYRSLLKVDNVGAYKKISMDEGWTGDYNFIESADNKDYLVHVIKPSREWVIDK